MGAVHITIDDANCCGCQSGVVCDCYPNHGVSPTKLTIGIMGIPANPGLGVGACQKPNPCRQWVDQYAECHYDRLNRSYELDVVWGPYGRWPELSASTTLGVFGDHNNPGLHIRTQFDCNDTVLSRLYVYRVSGYYDPCRPCPSQNPDEQLWDPTKLESLISITFGGQYLYVNGGPPAAASVGWYSGPNRSELGECQVSNCLSGAASMQVDVTPPYIVRLTAAVA